jgi:uncharacterized YigZ family protein
MKYKTVFKFSEIEITEKKSRFIGAAAPAETEAAARAFIEARRKLHYNATHNVFAYRIDENSRYSDDGEPQKTAGLPILNILRTGDIKKTVVVVARYFGGTLLGTGGLVRAYSEAAKKALETSLLIEKELYSKISLKFDYAMLGKLQREINKRDIILETNFYEKVELIVLTNDENGFFKLIKDASSATIKPELIAKLFVARVGGEIKLFSESPAGA